MVAEGWSKPSPVPRSSRASEGYSRERKVSTIERLKRLWLGRPTGETSAANAQASDYSKDDDYMLEELFSNNHGSITNSQSSDSTDDHVSLPFSLDETSTTNIVQAHAQPLVSQGNGDTRVDDRANGSFSNGPKTVDDTTTEKETSTPAKTPLIDLVTSVEQMLSHLPKISQDCCIFRVPGKLRQLNDKAYTPQLVSIGPLHRGKPELIGMEEYKMKYLKAFLTRTEMTTKRCLGMIRGFEQKIRKSYAETIGLGSDEFSKMVLVDSGFIIESLLRYRFNKEDQGLFHYARLDLILVENQLPFFVLDRIFQMAFIHYPRGRARYFDTLLKLSVHYLGSVLLISHPDIEEIFASISGEVKHFVDLVRMIHVPSSTRSTARTNLEYVRVQTATALQEAGMKFRTPAESKKSFLEMDDSTEGVLEIPQFRLNDCTEPVLRNLIALELQVYRRSSYIIDCALFMDGLIDSAKDVDILVKNEVIDNYLGESEVAANIFNNLTTQTLFQNDKYYFCHLSRRMNSYYKVPRHKWKATLKRDYFSTPFKVASVIAASALLLLTLMQTMSSIVALSQKDTYIALSVFAVAIAAIAIVVMVSIISTLCG